MHEPVILVLDDEEVILDQIEDILRFKGYHYVHRASDPNKVRSNFEQYKIDIFISDIMLANNENAIEVIREMQQRYNFILLFISGCQEDMFEKALPVKPDAYLIKPFSNMQVITTLKMLWNNYLISQEAKQPPTVNLTLREKEILQLLAAGCTSKEAALKLHLSTYTVQNHKARIAEKLEAGTTHEIVGKAYKLGLL